MQFILNTTDHYLLIQRKKNTQDIARILRKYNKYFMTRDMIPLDENSYPDPLMEDIRILHLLADKILIQLEQGMPASGMPQQLKLDFSPVFKRSWNEKDIPVEWETITRDEFIDERLNDMWIDLTAIHNKYGKKDLIPIKSEISRCAAYIDALAEMNDFKQRLTIINSLLGFVNELLTFIDTHYPEEKDTMGSILTIQKIKLHSRLSSRA